MIGMPNIFCTIGTDHGKRSTRHISIDWPVSTHKQNQSSYETVSIVPIIRGGNNDLDVRIIFTGLTR